MTAMTTSYCVDLLQRPDDERLRRRAHIGVALVFTLCILLFRLLHSDSVIDAIYVMCGYTYGPLLGLFAYAIFTKQGVDDRRVPYIAVISPLLCFALDTVVSQLAGYKFGYECLLRHFTLMRVLPDNVLLSACRLTMYTPFGSVLRSRLLRPFNSLNFCPLVSYTVML